MRYLHTMLHVTDLGRSVRFYTEIIGLKVHIERENPEGRYTLAYLGYGGITEPFLELRYNWDTKGYDHGNAFGHIAFSVKDINEACKKIEEGGGKIVREPMQMKNRKSIVAFAEDPDSYTIELVQRPGKPTTE